MRWILTSAAVTALFFVLIRLLPQVPRILLVMRAVFNFVPDVAAYFLAMAGVALPFMPDYLSKLEQHKKTRLLIAAVVFMVGVGAVISNSSQKFEDKVNAQADRRQLTNQLSVLVNSLADAIGKRTDQSLAAQKTERDNFITKLKSIQADVSKLNAVRPDSEYDNLVSKVAELRTVIEASGHQVQRPETPPSQTNIQLKHYAEALAPQLYQVGFRNLDESASLEKDHQRALFLAGDDKIKIATEQNRYSAQLAEWHRQRARNFEKDSHRSLDSS